MSKDYRWTDLFGCLNGEMLTAVADALSDHVLVPCWLDRRALEKLVCEAIPLEEFRAFLEHLKESHLGDEVGARVSAFWSDWRSIEGIGVARLAFSWAEEETAANEAKSKAEDDGAKGSD